MSNQQVLENWKGAYARPRSGRSALPCPFCGELPVIVPWHGGPRTKRMIMCRSDYCPVNPQVSGQTEGRALDAWNTRDG
jgi:hypothetical protein